MRKFGGKEILKDFFILEANEQDLVVNGRENIMWMKNQLTNVFSLGFWKICDDIVWSRKCKR